MGRLAHRTHQAAAGYTLQQSGGGGNPTDIEMLTRAAQARIFFGHQSVGNNIVGGIAAAYTAAGLPTPRVIDTRTAPADANPVFMENGIAENYEPIDKIDDFAAIMNGAMSSEVDVAFMKLCYVDVDASSSENDPDILFAHYQSVLASLEAAHPNVLFLHLGMPVRTDGNAVEVAPSAISNVTGNLGIAPDSLPTWMKRERYNSFMRANYGSTGRHWDLAARESAVGNGNVLARLYNSTYYVHTMNPAYASDGAHLNATGAQYMATELMKFIGARLLERD